MIGRLSSAPVAADSRDPTIRAVRVTAGALCVLGAVILVVEFARYLSVFPGPVTLAVVLEVPLLAIGFSVFRRLRPIRPPALIWSCAALVWGATAATGCALLANQGLTSVWAKTEGVGFASNWSASLSAPLNEEVLKLCGVIMVVLAAPHAIRGPLDGMIYGALTGLGFQVVENVTYGLDSIAQTGATDPGQAVASSAVARVITTGIGSHWTMTAVAGAGIGFLVIRERRREGGALAIICLLAAMAMHALFDAPHPALLLKVIVNFLIVGAAYLVLRESYMANAREVAAACVASGTISPAEAASAISRRSRRRDLLRARPGPQRDRVLARQRRVLATIEDEIARREATEPLLGERRAGIRLRLRTARLARADVAAACPATRTLLPHPRDRGNRGAEEHQVEDDLQGHGDARELARGVHVAEAHGRERAHGEVQAVGLGMQANELPGYLGHCDVSVGEEEDGEAQQQDQRPHARSLTGAQQPGDAQHDEYAKHPQPDPEQQRPGRLVFRPGHGQHVVDDRYDRNESGRARSLPQWPVIGHRPPRPR
jgi:protease PrsW